MSLEDAYLRVFINISKQKGNKIYALDDYNDATIPYRLEALNFIDGATVAGNYDMEENISTEVNFCWKYYAEKVRSEDVKIFDKIVFPNGIEEGYSYVVYITVELVNVSDFNETSQWKDKPVAWLNNMV